MLKVWFVVGCGVLLAGCVSKPPVEMEVPAKRYKNAEEWKADVATRNVDLSWFLEEVKKDSGQEVPVETLLPELPKSALLTYVDTPDKVSGVINVTGATRSLSKAPVRNWGWAFTNWCRSVGGVIEHVTSPKKYAYLWASYESSMRPLGFAPIDKGAFGQKGDYKDSVLTCFNKGAFDLRIYDRIAEITLLKDARFQSGKERDENRSNLEARRAGVPVPLKKGTAPSSAQVYLLVQTDRDLNASHGPFQVVDNEYRAWSSASSKPQEAVNPTKDLDTLRKSTK